MHPCLCLLIGPPGGGKSYLAGRIVAQLRRQSLRVERVEYDAEYEDGKGGTLDESTFKLYRERSQDRVRAALSEGTYDVVVADDIMYLRSMRREMYTLARDLNTVLACIHIDCSLDVALARNRSRLGTARLDDGVVERLHASFEPISKCTAEKHSLLVHNDTDSDQEVEAALDSICRLIHSARIDNGTCSSSSGALEQALVHEPSALQTADIFLRQRVGELMRNLKGIGLCNPATVKELKICKDCVLQKLRCELVIGDIDESTLREKVNEWFNEEWSKCSDL